jgi:hypothetical protein
MAGKPSVLCTRFTRGNSVTQVSSSTKLPTDQVRANIVSDNEKPHFETARTTLALTSESTPAGDPMQVAEARMRRALGLDGEQLHARPVQERVDVPQRSAERFSVPGHKRRFVHDGEVPVTLVHGLVPGRREHADTNGARPGANALPTNRLEVAEAALAAEIATRERAERALQEAQATIHDLQTKLGHADLARQEAVEALHRERESVVALRASLQEIEDRVAAAQQAGDVAEHVPAGPREDEVMASDDVAAVPLRPRRGRKPRPKALVPADTAATITPRKGPGRPRLTDKAPTHEPKPIRWWLARRTKKKR